METQVNTTLKYQNNTELEAIFMIENRCRLKTASSENSENNLIKIKQKQQLEKKKVIVLQDMKIFMVKLDFLQWVRVLMMQIN